MSGNKTPQQNDYIQRVIARARELRIADAFAAPDRQVGKSVSAAQAKATTAMHSRNARRDILVFSVALIIVVLASLCLPFKGMKVMGSGGGVYPPTEVLTAYFICIKTNIAGFFSTDIAREAATDLANFQATYGTDVYDMVLNRGIATVLVVVCGVMLAVSGTLFQTSFRNPLAAPTMLGVSDGVTLGVIIFSLMEYESVGDAPLLYAGLVYGLGALVVLAVVAFSRILSGGSRYNVLDMLLLGTVIAQLLGGINNYIQVFVLSNNAWDNFYIIQQATDAVLEPVLQVACLAVFVVTFLIVFVFRFKFNLLCFSNEEGVMMGVRTGAMRALALVVGSVMELAAMATVGQVAMLSLAVPFLTRFLLPADFRTQFLGNCLIGSLLLLVCMVIQHFFTVGYITLPLGTIVSLAIVPFFVWVVTFSEGKWS